METIQIASAAYAPPVDQLLRLGDCRRGPRPPYRIMGFAAEHVPELIRMSIDPELNHGDPDSDAVWAPVHAWRVLGLLRAEEAIEPLLGLFALDDSDWVNTEIPTVLGEIGPAAVPPVAALVADGSRDTWQRAALGSALAKIAGRWPEARAECVAVLVRLLEEEDDRTLLGMVVCDLLDLQAVEAAPAMERAFAEDRVELSAAGDWEDVQIELGLLTDRITPARSYLFDEYPQLAGIRIVRPPAPAHSHATTPASRSTAAKRRREKEARRKNRRRK